MGFSNKDDNDFDRDSYVSVNERLIEFYAKHPEGKIHTEVVFNKDEPLIIKASLFKKHEDTQPAATGHAFLTRLDGDKVGEYTETVAVGRALAFMGFKVEKGIATQEEMTRFKDNQDKADKKDPEDDEEEGEEKSEKDLPKLRAGRFKLPKRS